MPRKSRLSDFEKGQILAHKSNCWTVSHVADELRRSRNVVTSFLRNENGYNQKNNGGRPRKMTDADKRRIIREASKGLLRSTGIVKALQLSVKPRRVHQLLQETACLRYKRIARTPAMKEHHEKLRVKWATECMTWNDRKWNSVVWSDEKKFNLDGPDGLAYKWHDLRKQKEWFWKRHSGRASVMVWACFAGTSKSPLVFLEGKQD
ncbi:unnamed protein product [Chondrus crispus]|uniref:Tc3 transposase DNA binding domain-containing protein n=1 Tax=Chondrus crispus TaxID=2769 RepID=R7QSL6_CHOCR|nr:unnamed protein product [Chondrus crispus]CDF41124.1 unnamed protein product [Chondrus crispus]|eukprot:XP_005711418.1 unnamed protein product [Chondrus crispus]